MNVAAVDDSVARAWRTEALVTMIRVPPMPLLHLRVPESQKLLAVKGPCVCKFILGLQKSRLFIYILLFWDDGVACPTVCLIFSVSIDGPRERPGREVINDCADFEAKSQSQIALAL